MPDAHIGLPTGAASGLVVVDVDVQRGGDGFRAFSRAMDAGLIRRWACTVCTSSGGMHAYFSSTPGVEQRNWSVPRRHVDCRSDGGCVIATPSRVTTSDGTEHGLVRKERHGQDGRGNEAILTDAGLHTPRDRPSPPTSPAHVLASSPHPPDLIAPLAQPIATLAESLSLQHRRA